MIYIYNYSRFLLYLQGHENFILKHDKKKKEKTGNRRFYYNNNRSNKTR
jgi:hypothetical protein